MLSYFLYDVLYAGCVDVSILLPSERPGRALALLACDCLSQLSDSSSVQLSVEPWD